MTNEQKYKTPEERLAAFREYCDKHREKFNGCTIGNCPLRTTSTRACQFFWLALEAEEELLACPFCGSTDIKVIQATVSGYVATCNDCWAASRAEITKDDAIAAWNRRVE